LAKIVVFGRNHTLLRRETECQIRFLLLVGSKSLWAGARLAGKWHYKQNSPVNFQIRLPFPEKQEILWSFKLQM
jgi:hypothetical protein